MNTHHCANELPMYKSSNYIDDSANRVGRLDYFGCLINKKVSSLDLAFSRLTSTSAGVPARYSQGLTLQIFYGVLKAIVKDGKGGFQVVYL